MKFGITSLLSLALALCWWPACAADAASMGGQAAGSFARADRDGNGVLSREEFRAAFPSVREEAFAAIDSNGDGGIDAAEWASFLQNHGAGGMRGPKGAGATPPAATPPAQGGPLLVTPPDGK